MRADTARLCCDSTTIYRCHIMPHHAGNLSPTCCLCYNKSGRIWKCYRSTGREDTRSCRATTVTPPCPALLRQNLLSAALPDGSHMLNAAAGCGNDRVVGVKNTDAEEILRQAVVLRNSAGRRTYLKVKHRHQLPLIRGDDGSYARASASVQGSWQRHSTPGA